MSLWERVRFRPLLVSLGHADGGYPALYRRLRHFFDFDACVEVRDSASGVENASANDDVSLGPMNLQVSAGNRSKEDAAFEPAELIGESDALALNESQAGGVIGVHQDSVPWRAVKRVHVSINERVELFSTPG